MSKTDPPSSTWRAASAAYSFRSCIRYRRENASYWRAFLPRTARSLDFLTSFIMAGLSDLRPVGKDEEVEGISLRTLEQPAPFMPRRDQRVQMRSQRSTSLARLGGELRALRARSRDGQGSSDVLFDDQSRHLERVRVSACHGDELPVRRARVQCHGAQLRPQRLRGLLGLADGHAQVGFEAERSHALDAVFLGRCA